MPWSEVIDELLSIRAGSVAELKCGCVLSLHKNNTLQPGGDGRQLGGHFRRSACELVAARHFDAAFAHASPQPFSRPFADFTHLRHRQLPRGGRCHQGLGQGMREYLSRLPTSPSTDSSNPGA